MKIAVYGKGGIGKSTISANLSAALARKGRSVLQIGCDPKHDSTRLLHHGQQLQTVLDYLLSTKPEQQTLRDLLITGFGGVKCIEAGGPKAGMGCAGRGILTAFDFLDRNNANSLYDDIIYDVLGDVVCGGFAVPVRRQYAQAIFLVTSGESMAVYAANNILRGIQNLNPGEKRVAGIILNSRAVAQEESRVQSFAQSVGLPICAQVPRSEAFACAERNAVTVVEEAPGAVESAVFLELANQIIDGLPLFEAHPLDEINMEAFMREKSSANLKAPSANHPPQNTFSSRSDTSLSAIHVSNDVPDPDGRPLADPFGRVPLYGCAFNGALALSIHIIGIPVLAHAPKSCVWFSNNGYSAYGRRGVFERGILFPVFSPSGVISTDITAQDAIFGGMANVREKLLQIAARNPKAIILITSCIPGIIGDDLDSLEEEMLAQGIPLWLVRTDGVEAGDYNDGMALFYKQIALRAIDRLAMPGSDSINIVYESVISSGRARNHLAVKAILDALDIRINCRFLCETSFDEVRGFLHAPWNIMAHMDSTGTQLQRFFEQEYGCKFFDAPLPAGFRQTSRWVKKLAALYGRKEQAHRLIEESKIKYNLAVEPLRKRLSGTRILLFVTQANHSWLTELAEDLELQVVKTAILGKETQSNPAWNQRFSTEWVYDRKHLLADLTGLKPDVVLTGDASAVQTGDALVFSIPLHPDVGFYSGIRMAEKLAKSLENHIQGSWKNDAILFKKHFG